MSLKCASSSNEEHMSLNTIRKQCSYFIFVIKAHSYPYFYTIGYLRFYVMVFVSLFAVRSSRRLHVMYNLHVCTVTYPHHSMWSSLLSKLHYGKACSTDRRVVVLISSIFSMCNVKRYVAPVHMLIMYIFCSRIG